MTDPLRSPLAATFSGDRSRTFLEENGELWTVGRLLALAADIDRAIRRGPLDEIAIRSQSSAFVVASLIAAWRNGLAPLLVDPALRAQAAGLDASRGRAEFLAPDGEPGSGAAIQVREEGSAPLDPVLPKGDSPEVAFLTSGSTGEPKRAIKRADQLAREFEVEPGWLQVPRPCTVLCLVPPFHILGYIYGFYLPAATGGRTTFLRGATPQDWVERIRALSPDLVVGVPSHYRLIAGIVRESLPAATFLSSGALLPADVGERFASVAGRRIRQVFGSTETGGIATRDDDGAWTPLPGLEWKTEPGDDRLVIRSPWQERPGSWHRADDLAEPAGEGFRLLGRADSIVKVGGRRFSTSEIVQAALEHPAVEQAHTVTYGRYGETAVALFVTVAKGTEEEEADLRAHLAGRLAPFKVPRTIRVLDAIPTLGSGKVDAEALRSLVAAPDAP